MLCINPFRKASAEFGCGQCLPCRVNRRRTWAARIVLESCAHAESSFVTLTYSEEHSPANGSLSKADWRSFTKGIGFRYFGCGEYGGRTMRPHYHLVLFGIPALEAERLVEKRWQKGFFTVRPFCVEHAAYIAAYTVKKLTSSSDSRLPPGCIPEFALMSRRPGVGVPGLVPFERWLTSAGGCSFLSRVRDVPSSVRIAGRIAPVGRLLRDRLRASCDIPSDDPLRTMAREGRFRAERSLPEFVALREKRRGSQYQRLKALDRVRHGQI